MALDVEVVVPAHMAAGHLERCLKGLFAAGVAAPRIIVVDDASTDATADIAAALGVRVIRREVRGGPAATRNTGTAACEAEIVLFVDADVVVHANVLDHVQRAFATPGVTAVFGSYDAHPPSPGLVSRYRNLLHHFVHQEANPNAATFWTGCGAVRRSTLNAVAGFDTSLYTMEDVDLGMRMHARGWRISLDPNMLCTHLKRWTLANMIRTDVRWRALPWTRMILAQRELPVDLNLSHRQRFAVALTGVFGGAILLLPLWSGAGVIALAAGTGVLAANGRFFGFLARSQGLGFALAAFPLHLVHHACAGIGFGYGVIEHALGSFRFGRGSTSCRDVST